MKTLHPDIIASAERLGAEYPNDTVSVATADGTYVYVSPAHLRILGYSPEDLIGHNYKKVSVRPTNFNNIHLVDIALTSELVHMDYLARAKSGKLITMTTIARTILDPDTGERFIIARSKVIKE